MKRIIISIAVLLLIGLTNTYAQSFKVVVNATNSSTAITAKEASDLFLKKKSKWTDGTAVVPVDQTSNSTVRDEFSTKIHGKNTAAIRNFWQQAAFSGTATAPAEKTSDEEVIEFVKKNPGAIGYVSASTNVAGVKTLAVN